jgi:CRISPR/Cas system-associated exonuclease Cas4 (RecB family)
MTDPVKKIYEKLAQVCLDKTIAYYKPGIHFRCSEADSCVRKLWYRLSGFRAAARQPIFEVYGICGDADHDITRQLMEFADVPVLSVTQNKDGSIEENLLLDETFQVENGGEMWDVRIRGRSDGEVVTEHGQVLLEIKGTGFWYYTHLQKAFDKSGLKGVLDRIRGVEPDNSDGKHLNWYAQCQMSMGMTGHLYTYLLVKDRATGTLGFFKEKTDGTPDEDTRTGIHLPFDEDFFDKTLQRFAYVLRKLDEGKPPVAEFTRGSKPCKQCDFYYLCHGRNKDGSVTYPGPQLDMEDIDGDAMVRQESVAVHDDGGVGGHGPGEVQQTMGVEEADPDGRLSE